MYDSEQKIGHEGLEESSVGLFVLVRGNELDEQFFPHSYVSSRWGDRTW